MINNLRKTIKGILPKFLLDLRESISHNKYKLISYSFEGEDLILNRIFGNQTDGFYVDVGAHHPIRFSNTYFFYQRGWKGINLDAMPGSMKPFKRIRPRDINLEIPISTSAIEMDYFVFNEPALNGFSKEISTERNNSKNEYFIKGVIKLKSARLEEILEKYLPQNQKIDFFSIDVEGYDLEVLKSNNWSKFRPNYIVIEILENDTTKLLQNETHIYLQQNGYVFYAKSSNSCIYKCKD